VLLGGEGLWVLKDPPLRLRTYISDAERHQEELERIRAQKEKLKARVRASRSGGSFSTHRPSPPSSTAAPPTNAPRSSETRFRSMEVERDLSSLKERLRRELEDDDA
ncbi:MAG: hypothetical protein AAFX99_09320, partial [Myxococcota bacterium]